MDTVEWILTGAACTFAGFLIADRYSKQGFNFWKTFITSSAVLFAIVVMFITQVLG